MRLQALVFNELGKILARRKMLLITVIVLAMSALFSYGQNYQYKHIISRYQGTSGKTASIPWEGLVRQQISDLNRRLTSPYTRSASLPGIRIQISQNEYYLKHHLNPVTPSAAKFSVKLMEQSIFLLLPLLIIILAGDIVSGEFTQRTIKVLLTRAVPRWKILLSKYIALLLLTSIILVEIAVVSILVSGIQFSAWGFSEPVATGFRTAAGKLDASHVIKVLQWQYLILVYSLGWFVAVVVGSLSFMVSVLVRNTSTSIGIMMASLIGGGFLQLFLADWPAVKYFYVLNLNLPQYLTGSYQPVAGMSMGFSVAVLSVWTVAALMIGFTVFQKQDVLV